LLSSKACLAEGKAFVGPAVAVLIGNVARYLRACGGTGLGVADRVGFPVHAHQAALTGTDAPAVGALVAQARDVVDGAVAVVVLVIADLGAGSTRICVAAGSGKTVTDDLALALASAFTRLTRIAEAIKVLVGAAVAVVVAIVAHLICRGTWIPLADDFAASRDAYALTFSGASSNAHGTPADAGEFVGAAVTVVVHAIADICLRKDFSLASCPVALGVAGLRTCGTCTLPQGAIGAAVALPLLPWKAVAGEPSDVVNGAVAVIVETVTDLDVVGAAPAAVVAGGVLVDGAVAVVVNVVADLRDALLLPLVFHAEVCRGQYLGVGGARVPLLTGINSAHALLIRPVAGIARIPALAATIEGEALIDAAIVVVVQAVAELGVARICFPAVCDGIVAPAITQASIGGGHIRGHRVGPAVAGASAVSGGAVAPTTSTTLATVSALLDADVGWEILDAATEAAYEDVEENEDGPRTSSTPGDRGHCLGFGDSPPFWAVVIAVTSAHCVLVFSFYKPQK
jgi:hypothetical protein